MTTGTLTDDRRFGFSGRWLARTTGILYSSGALVAFVYVLLPHGAEAGDGVVLAMAILALALGLALAAGVGDRAGPAEPLPRRRSAHSGHHLGRVHRDGDTDGSAVPVLPMDDDLRLADVRTRSRAAADRVDGDLSGCLVAAHRPTSGCRAAGLADGHVHGSRHGSVGGIRRGPHPADPGAAAVCGDPRSAHRVAQPPVLRRSGEPGDPRPRHQTPHRARVADRP